MAVAVVAAFAAVSAERTETGSCWCRMASGQRKDSGPAESGQQLQKEDDWPGHPNGPRDRQRAQCDP